MYYGLLATINALCFIIGLIGHIRPIGLIFRCGILSSVFFYEKNFICAAFWRTRVVPLQRETEKIYIWMISNSPIQRDLYCCPLVKYSLVKLLINSIMAKGYYEYKIKISFSSAFKECTKLKFKTPYPKGNRKTDEICFSPKMIDIRAHRSRKCTAESIMFNCNNSINAQITKALLFYYAVSSKIPQIDKIQIACFPNKEDEQNTIYTSPEEVLQPLMCVASTTKMSVRPIRQILFNEDERGKSLRIVMSYWLKAQSCEDVGIRFDYLWRAFNRIYQYHHNGGTEFDCLCDIRQFLLNNYQLFPKTIYNAVNISALSTTFRWNKMITNNYPTISNTDAFADMIKRYTDSRIMNLFQERLSIREEYLRTMNRYQDVLNHISSNLHTKNDIELVVLLCVKYGYYVRNKSFHGETLATTFRIGKDSVYKEFDALNNVFTSLICEFIEHYDLV